MSKATLTSKGQITLPAKVRRAFIRCLKGVVPAPAMPVTLEAMEAAIRSRASPKVIALDTNVLVRYLAQDDREQARTSTRFTGRAAKLS